MTINIANNNPRINYTATANQTVFTVPFEFFDNTDIKVYIEGTLKTITTHYTVSGGNGSTGTVTLTAGATLNDEVTLVRDVPLERTTDLTSSYNASSLDAQLDRIVAEIADLDDRVSRTIQINDYELASGLLLPALDSRKGKTIQFNTSSGALEVGPTGADLTAIGSVTSEIATLAGISGNITTVAGSNAQVVAVGNSMTSITAINSALSNVNTVAGGISNINLVGGSIADVNDVADSLGEISAVQAKLTNIDTVAVASTNIGTVAGSISQVNTVASKIADVTGVNNNISAITTANANSTNINLVANNIDDVNDVGTVITKVTTVADNIANVNLVAPNAQYLSDVANNITAINAIAPLASDLTNVTDNLTAIQNAGTNATNAASSATSAATSATAAQTAKTAAETALDEFTDIYLGSKSVAPTVDNDGNALATGSIYWNSGVDQLYIWDGSAWDDAAFTASGAVTSFNTRTGAVTLSSADVTNAAGLLTTGGTMTGALNVESTITSDGLTVDGDAVFTTGDTLRLNTSDGSDNGVLAVSGGGANSDARGARVRLYGNEHASLSGALDIGAGNVSGGHIYNYTNAKLRQKIDYNGDISFYEDTGTTAKFFWDASAESLGIGISSPQKSLDVEGSIRSKITGGASPAEIDITSGGTWRLRSNATSGTNAYGMDIVKGSAGTDVKMSIDSSGNVGIGISSPSRQLEIYDDGTVGQAVLALTAQNTDPSRIMFADPDDVNIGILDYHHSDNSMRFIVNNAESMRIDSSGRVGIGTSSLGGGRGLTVANGAISVTSANLSHSTSSLVLSQNDSSLSQIRFYGANTSTAGILQFDGSSSDGSVGGERMRIDSSGNVGIGTSSPNTLLHLSTTAGTQLRLTAASNNYAYLEFGDTDDEDIGRVQYSNIDNSMSFHTNASERMRIDSSGNLLVGTTNNTIYNQSSDEGMVYRAGNSLDVARASGQPLILNRLTNDGTIADFRKDGTQVGSIGVDNTDNLTISGNSSHCGLNFSTDDINPYKNGAYTNGTTDLGTHSSRFKDLHLSGTIEIENGTGNVSVGKQALNSNTATHNTAVGYQAGYNQTNGGHYNTYTGYRAGWRNTGGDFNTYYGYEAGFDNTGGTGNIFIGRSSGYYMDGGNYNTIIGGYNGNQGGLDIRTSSNHIVLADGNGNPRLVINSNGRQAFANGNANGHGNFVGEVGTSSKALMFEHTVNGGETGSITTGSSSTSYNTSSDHRLKENVDYTWDATTRLKQLKPARFNFIADADTTVDGFLAHEVQAVVPEAVHGTHNEVDDDGNAVMQGIDQSKLVPLLVKTIQELEARITALEGA